MKYYFSNTSSRTHAPSTYKLAICNMWKRQPQYTVGAQQHILRSKRIFFHQNYLHLSNVFRLMYDIPIHVHTNTRHQYRTSKIQRHLNHIPSPSSHATGRKITWHLANGLANSMQDPFPHPLCCLEGKCLWRGAAAALSLD